MRIRPLELGLLDTIHATMPHVAVVGNALSQRCIYRGVALNNNRIEDSDTASVEHIIPWAIGGSNSVTTSDVSKLANNDLGSKVDAPFASTLPIALKRHQLELKSQGGNIPPIIWRAKALKVSTAR